MLFPTIDRFQSSWRHASLNTAISGCRCRITTAREVKGQFFCITSAPSKFTIQQRCNNGMNEHEWIDTLTPEMRGVCCRDGSEIKHGQHLKQRDEAGGVGGLIRMQMFSMARLMSDIDLSDAPRSMLPERGLLGNICWPIG